MTQPSLGEHQYATQILMPASRNLQPSARGVITLRMYAGQAVSKMAGNIAAIVTTFGATSTNQLFVQCGMQGWLEL